MAANLISRMRESVRGAGRSIAGARWTIAVWAVSIALMVALQWPSVRILLMSNGEQTQVDAIGFSGSGAPSDSDELGVYSGDWVVVGGTLCLPPGGQGSVVWTVRKDSRENTLLRFKAPAPRGVDYALSVVAGGVEAGVARGRRTTGREWIDLEPIAGSLPTLEVRLRAAAAKDAEPDAAVLERLWIYTTLLTAGALGPIGGLAGLILAPCFVFVVLGMVGAGLEKRLRAAAAAILITGLASALVPGFARHGSYLFAGIVILAGAGLLWKKRLREIGPRMAPWALASVVVVLAGLRWGFVAQNALTLDLAPDVKSFIEIIGQANHPFDTAHREPLFLWMIWLTRTWVGTSDLAIRFLNCLIGAGSLALAWAVGRRLGGAAAGLAGMLVLGYINTVIYHGARGLRIDAYVAGLLILTWALWVPERSSSSWRRAAAVGAAAGALGLLRVTAFPLGWMMIAWFGWRRRWSWTHLALAAALSLALVFPHLIHIKRVKGDFFYESRRVATFYADLEKTGKVGQPTGESVSMGEYIFGQRSFGEAALRMSHGMWESMGGYYAREDVFGGNLAVWALSLVGAAAAVWRRKWDMLFLPSLFALPTAFLAVHIGVFDPRLVVHLTPFLGFWAGFGVESVWLIGRFFVRWAIHGKGRAEQTD